MKINVWMLILFIAVLETIAMSIIEDSANKNNKYYIFGIILYTIIAYLLYNILKIGDIAITNALWNTTTVILVSLVGILYFEEKFTTYQYIGLGFAILAIIFIEMPNLKKLFK
jgi:multidrug transporter EmrE-like cation transporter